MYAIRSYYGVEKKVGWGAFFTGFGFLAGIFFWYSLGGESSQVAWYYKSFAFFAASREINCLSGLSEDGIGTPRLSHIHKTISTGILPEHRTG